MKRSTLVFAALAACGVATAQADPAPLKPFVLASTSTEGMAQVVGATKAALVAHGFKILGTYQPYPTATVICATDRELETQAAKAEHGGFGVAERVAVTDVKGSLQVSYANPEYVGTAYGLGMLPQTTSALKAALGDQKEFGAQGMQPDDLKPGSYHYAFGMPYFTDVNVLNEFPTHAAAVATVERNLAAGVAGVHKVYEITLPGTQTTVFGVGFTQGEEADAHVMKIIDFKPLRSTAHLPYEFMVQGNQIIALRARYRIAVDFPDLSMFGAHGFTHIMHVPYAIKKALGQVAGSSNTY